MSALAAAALVIIMLACGYTSGNTIHNLVHIFISDQRSVSLPQIPDLNRFLARSTTQIWAISVCTMYNPPTSTTSAHPTLVSVCTHESWWSLKAGVWILYWQYVFGKTNKCWNLQSWVETSFTHIHFTPSTFFPLVLVHKKAERIKVGI